MSLSTITLAVGSTTLALDPDLWWRDEFEWSGVTQTIERGLTGALIIDVAAKVKGRLITLAPPSDVAAWMPRATLTQLQAWEAEPDLELILNLRGAPYTVAFNRQDGSPIEAHPHDFVANPLPGKHGDWYLCTLRLIEV